LDTNGEIPSDELADPLRMISKWVTEGEVLALLKSVQDKLRCSYGQNSYVCQVQESSVDFLAVLVVELLNLDLSVCRKSITALVLTSEAPSDAQLELV
jgi:hypothetical protein